LQTSSNDSTLAKLLDDFKLSLAQIAFFFPFCDQLYEVFFTHYYLEIDVVLVSACGHIGKVKVLRAVAGDFETMLCAVKDLYGEGCGQREKEKGCQYFHSLYFYNN